jgi:hypothetical protein
MCVARDGQGPATASLPAGEGEADGVADAEAAAVVGGKDADGVGLLVGVADPLQPARSNTAPALAMASEARMVPPHLAAAEVATVTTIIPARRGVQAGRCCGDADPSLPLH